jgi:hypothetical protein
LAHANRVRPEEGELRRGPVKKQMGVALDDALRSRLETSAAAKDHSLAEEIRQRLEHDFKEEAIDPVTRELVTGIIRLAETILLDLGAAWHASPKLHEAFAAAVTERLAGYAPPPRVEEASWALGLLGAPRLLSHPEDSPQTIGRTHERHDQRSHSYEHLQAAQRAKMSRLARRASKAIGRKKGNDQS